MNQFISKIIIFIFGNNPHICTIIMSMLPIIEVRGTIPFSLSYEIWTNPLSEIESIIFCCLGSTIATALLLYFIPKILTYIKRKSILYKSLEHKLLNAKKQSNKLNKLNPIKKYIYIGIFTFLPIPLTGYYTSSLIATSINMKFIPTLISISIGNLGCALLITFLSDLLNKHMLLIFYVFIIVLLLYIIYILIKLIKNKKNA